MQRLSMLVGFMMISVPTLAAEPKELPPINAAVVKFCESKEGKRVGGGECSHLANEALRIADAEFTQVGTDGKRIPDFPDPGDYVWGRKLKTYSFDAKTNKVSDSDPKTKCLPGDILQFRDVKISSGASFPHHTAIVRTVDDAGNPTGIYQQNFSLPKGGDGRVVQKSALQTLKLVSGRIMAYRPEKPTNPFQLQFTWTNNSKSKTVEFTWFGKKDKLGTPNTSDGYRMVWATGKGAEILKIGDTEYTIKSRAGYEFYTTEDGKLALREVK
ncbi:MAG TPA: hypothetical protein VG097_02680 [Gemmata sp.]|jgi:hypothetical protein|nr:hypothetical protein [Gemmata sp.]